MLNTTRKFDIDKQDQFRNTALSYCMHFSEKTSNESLKIAERLLEKGANPNAIATSEHKKQEGPLIVLCSKYQKPELLEVFLKHGALVDAVDSKGNKQEKERKKLKESMKEKKKMITNIFNF